MQFQRTEQLDKPNSEKMIIQRCKRYLYRFSIFFTKRLKNQRAEKNRLKLSHSPKHL